MKTVVLINLQNKSLKWLYKQQGSQPKKYQSQRLSYFVEQWFWNPV